MPDFITKRDVKSVLRMLADKMDDGGFTALSQGIAAVEDMTPSDAVLVQRGKWERRTKKTNVSSDIRWVCSVCGYQTEAKFANTHFHYCPNCGANLMGEPHDE